MFRCGKCPPVTIVIQASLSLPCALHAESQWEGNVHGHCFPEDRLAARAINYNRQGDRQTDRQTVLQRAQTGPGSWSRPDKYKEARGGAARTAEGDGKNQSSRCGASAPTAGQCVTAIRHKKQASVMRDKAMRDGDK